MPARDLIDGLVSESAFATVPANQLRSSFIEFKALDGDDPRKIQDLLSFIQSRLGDGLIDLSLSPDFKEVLPQMAAHYRHRTPKRRVSEDLEEFDTTVTRLDGEDVAVTVKFDYDNVGYGDAGFTGRPGVAPWVEDIIDQSTGKSILNLVSQKTLGYLVDEIVDILHSRR
jgi:hypothetical protein